MEAELDRDLDRVASLASEGFYVEVSDDSGMRETVTVTVDTKIGDALQALVGNAMIAKVTCGGNAIQLNKSFGAEGIDEGARLIISYSTKKVTKIAGNSGQRIDGVTFFYSDDTSEQYGRRGGIKQREFTFAEDEYIVQIYVKSFPSYWGNAFKFVTNQGRSFDLYGIGQGSAASTDECDITYEAAPGRHLVSLVAGDVSTKKSIPQNAEVGAVVAVLQDDGAEAKKTENFYNKWAPGHYKK